MISIDISFFCFWNYSAIQPLMVALLKINEKFDSKLLRKMDLWRFFFNFF